MESNEDRRGRSQRRSYSQKMKDEKEKDLLSFRIYFNISLQTQEENNKIKLTKIDKKPREKLKR